MSCCVYPHQLAPGIHLPIRLQCSVESLGSLHCSLLITNAPCHRHIAQLLFGTDTRNIVECANHLSSGSFFNLL